MNVAIVGYGEQGRSSFEYWFNKGHVVVICDANPDIELPPAAIDKLGPGYLDNLNQFDLIVRSPSVHPNTILEANLGHPEIKDKITSNTAEFFNVCKAPIIGVTGTKGKGTTSTLITRILEEYGKKVHLGGNIGTPPLDLLKNSIAEDDVVVLELANFQLIDMKQSPHIAVCLAISEEHLNWHADMYEYIKAKEQIFAHQTASDIAVYNAKNVYATKIISSSLAHTKIGYDAPDIDEPLEFTDGVYVQGEQIKAFGKTVMPVTDVSLKGRHNLQNICAAIAATWGLTSGNVKVLKKAIKSFVSLPHRLEKVRVLNDVTYYNDSFSASPSATVAAIKAIPETKVLIIGGVDKSLDLSDLAQNIYQHNSDIRKVLIIGEVAKKLEQELLKHNFVNYQILENVTMKDIVRQAQSLAHQGDAVLLSPGTSSFDMFKNFEDRGVQFKQFVNAL